MKFLAGFSLALFTTSLAADPFFTGNPWSVIPPGCVTRPDLQEELYGDHAIVVFDGKATMRTADGLHWPDNYALQQPAQVQIRRVGCAEPGRSALFVRHRISPGAQQGYSRRYVVPNYLWGHGGTLGWLTQDQERPGALGDPPGHTLQTTFGDYSAGWLGEPFGSVLSWTYVLDAPGPLPNYPQPGPITADRYNDELALVSDQHFLWGPVPAPWIAPATRTTAFGNVPMPLNGRLTGTWVSEGASDQGVNLSFSNRVPATAADSDSPERGPVLLFLAWYTFDAAGRMLWLTGSGEFEQGATSVDIELVLVTDGEFLGTRRAQRQPAGMLTLSARSCNELVLDFALSRPDRQDGSLRLKRLHELEIAGYNCRDHEARRVAAWGSTAVPHP